MNVRPVALIAALLPFFAVHTTYLLAAGYGLVDWCNPYYDSCTSISATGRKPPASYLFRATMLPSAVVMMAYWWLNFAWLQQLWRRSRETREDGRVPAADYWMLWLGLLACVGLILYVTVLGERGDAWATQRRVGTVLFFSFTYLAQLLLARQLLHLKSLLPASVPPLLRAMLGICVVLLVVGLLTVLIDARDADYYESVEDAFEWVLTLLLQSNFLLGYFVWRRVGWSLEVIDESKQ